MPPQNSGATDAWADDWVTAADVRLPLNLTQTRAHSRQREDEKPKEEQPMPKLSKAERKAQHAEQNRQLWQSAYVTPHPSNQCCDLHRVSESRGGVPKSLRLN
jgi:hypothetical protein